MPLPTRSAKSLFGRSPPKHKPEPPQIEPMHLWHLFLWTASCAVVLGYLTSLFSENEGDSIEKRLLVFSFGIMAGTSLLGMILAIPSLRRCPRIEPGHYLLIAQWWGYLLAIIPILVSINESSLRRWLPNNVLEGSGLLPFLGTGVLLGWSIFNRHTERRWRYLLTAMGVYLVIGAITFWLMMALEKVIKGYPYRSVESIFTLMSLLYTGSGSVILFVLLGISIRDRLKKVPHGWLHLLGVLTMAIWGLLPLVALLLMWWA